MNDTRTEQQKYMAWVKAVNVCAANGWVCLSKWIFRSPSGTVHDLSASDLNKLDYIEKNGLFLV